MPRESVPGSQSHSGGGGEVEIPSPRRESNPRTPIVWSIAQRYTERVTYGKFHKIAYITCLPIFA
jgi:hypothetical protein